MLALVRTDARVDTQVVLQVIVVDKFGVTMEADVGALTCVLPHVDLEFVLSEKKKTVKAYFYIELLIISLFKSGTSPVTT